MAWSIPPTGQWNPGIAQLTPDINMTSYTPEQWAVVQQQNWHQWAQWQQQYAQWQSQYGEKYAEQMQAMQTMSGMPPLPPSNSAPPPAPPPPDQPPPPPPHENNRPLYGQMQPAPVPPPAQPQQRNTGTPSYNNTNKTPGNNPNWSYNKDIPVETTQSAINSVNSEALKKLAEEERLFDVQFQKWEEEIQKWKRENVNHPDKQAYKEYEQKFEACRAQLLERRQQMKQKRARLLSNTPQPTNITATGNVSTVVPPPLQSSNKNMHTQSYTNTQNYQDSQYQKYDKIPQTTYNRNNNKNIDPQDRCESYQQMNEDNLPVNSDSSNFLLTSGSTKTIPGLDLIPEADKQFTVSKELDVIEILDEHTDNQNQEQQQQAPDYSKISKGINNILGDEKIMNILSMVRGQTDAPPNNNNNQNANVPIGLFAAKTNNYNVPQTNQWNRNENYNVNSYNNQNQYDDRQDTAYNNRQSSNYSMQQNLDQGSRYPPPTQKRAYDERQNMPQQQYYDRNNQNQYGGQNIHPRQGPPPMRDNIPPPRPLLQNTPVPRPLLQNTPTPRPLMQNMPAPRPLMQNTSEHRPLMQDMPRPLMQDMPRPLIQDMPKPLLQNIPTQQNVNNFENRDMHENRGIHDNSMNQNTPIKAKWVDEPMFTPSIIVEYGHKALRLKARDFIEPVHMFDYDHKSKYDEYKKKDFEREGDELFSRKPRRSEIDEDYKNRDNRYSRDQYSRDFERRVPRDDRDDHRSRLPPRDDYVDRRRFDERYDDRRRDDRYSRNEDSYRDRERDRERDRDRDRDRERDREIHNDRHRDYRRDDTRNRSRSREKDLRKRGRSKESTISNSSGPKKLKDQNNAHPFEVPKHIVMIDDLLEPPGREMRPDKIVIILRGPPGSGKSYLAKLIRDREAEYGGTARIMSLDDYFMQEGEIEEKDPTTGKIIKKPSLKYEYDEKCEETYMNSLKRAFKRSLTDGYFSFLIFDAVNDQLKHYADIWNYARQNGFQVYICTMELDPQTCFKRNVHGRTLDDIQVISARFFPTPSHHIQLDATTLLQSAAIPEVHMEDVDDVVMDDAQEIEVESVFTSKWEKMDDAVQLARLDGISKPLRPSQLSMEDYLQLDDWKPNKVTPGKKTVHWADIEERRQQEKIRAIGFVVGQTDWNRMTDPTMGSSALTQTKYIERVRRT